MLSASRTYKMGSKFVEHKNRGPWPSLRCLRVGPSLLDSKALKARHGNSKNRRRIVSVGEPAAALISPRRRLMFILSAFVLVPALALGLLEGILRVAGFGFDASFFRKVSLEGREWLVNNDDFVQRFFSPEKARLPRPFMIEAHKPPETFRIFVFGESAAEGDPDPAYGPARFLEVLLRERFPQQRFEVVNVAITANNSHGILPIARECAQHEGDLWLIYMGNNEMVGPFGAATVFGSQAAPLLLVRANLALQKTRVGQLLTTLGRHFARQKSSASAWRGLEMFVENRVGPNDSRKDIVYRNFQSNLQDILEAGLNSGAKVVLSSMAVNLRDCPPLASMSATNLATADQMKLEALNADADAAESRGDFSGATQALEQAAALDASRADLQYRWGICLLKLTNYAAAREHLQRACDSDALPARADSRINAAIREACRRFAGKNLVLFEAPLALTANSASGICGDETFYEHVHFNVSGSYRLGRGWAEEVEHFLPIAVGRHAAGPWASAEFCERRLALTDWNRRNDLNEIVGRRHAPPLSGQRNNAQELAALQRELASLDLSAANAARARQVCREAIERAPEDMDLHANYADLLDALAEPKLAAEQWREVQKLRPMYYMGYFQEGRMLERLGELESARAAFEGTIALRPGMAPAWFELSNIDASEGKLELALQEIDCARQRQPHQPAYYACKGRLLSRLNRHAEAVQRYRQALEVDSNYWDGRIALGEELAAAGSLPAAQIEFETGVRLRPDSVRAHLDLGATLARQGQVAAAAREFENSLRLEPGNRLAQEALDHLRAPGAGQP